MIYNKENAKLKSGVKCKIISCFFQKQLQGLLFIDSEDIYNKINKKFMGGVCINNILLIGKMTV